MSRSIREDVRTAVFAEAQRLCLPVTSAARTLGMTCQPA